MLKVVDTLEKTEAARGAALEAFVRENPIPHRPEPVVSPNNPPWGSGLAILSWFISILLLLLCGGIVMVIYALAKGTQPNELSQLIQDPVFIFWSLLATIPAHILTFIFGWAVVTQNGKHPFLKTLGWKWGGLSVWLYPLMLVGFFGVYALLSSFFPEQEHELMRALRSSRAAVYAVAFMAVFTAPLVEELIYRGILYSAFQKSFGVPAAVLLVSFLFALVHFQQYMESPVALLMICLLSFALTLIRVWSGNLLPCVVAHTVFNGIQALGLILFPESVMSSEKAAPASFFFSFF
jgi:hypothetical protein